MRSASPYLPWAKTAGSALLIGVPAYLWASALGLSYDLPFLGWQGLLAACLAIPFAFLTWADRSSGSAALRKAYLGLMGLCLAAAAFSGPIKETIPWALEAGLFVAALGTVSLVWQKDRSPAAWQRKTLWAFVAAPVPSVLMGSSRALPPAPSLLWLSSIMIAGATLCLTGNEEAAGAKRPVRRLVSIAALIIVLGYLASSLAPGASSAASWGLRGALGALRELILWVLKPVTLLVGWMIELLLLVLKKGEENESPLNPFEILERPEELREHAPSVVWSFIGYVIAVVLIILALRALWKILNKYVGTKTGVGSEETRSSEYSASRAARWAVDKIKELGSPLAAILTGRFRRKAEGEPLVLLYGEFLALAASSGFARVPSQTPLEFSKSLAEKWPDSALHIDRITGIFASRFYAGRAATEEELSVMRQSLAALETAFSGQKESD